MELTRAIPNNTWRNTWNNTSVCWGINEYNLEIAYVLQFGNKLTIVLGDIVKVTLLIWIDTLS